jgi:hypothetical protein
VIAGEDPATADGASKVEPRLPSAIWAALFCALALWVAAR